MSGARSLPPPRVRLRAYVVSALLALAVASPALRDPAEDGFPLSTYPMFSRARQRLERYQAAIAVAPDGGERVVPARYVANAEPMQAVATLGQSVRAGRKAAKALCRGIAGRLAASDDPALSTAREVRVVTRELDAVAFLAGETTARSEQVHARCDVPATR